MKNPIVSILVIFGLLFLILATPTPGKADTYTLDCRIYPLSGGSVFMFPDQATYDYRTEVKLIPIPQMGWKFSLWGGKDADDLIDNEDGSWSIRMNENKTIQVTFEAEMTDLPQNLIVSPGNLLEDFESTDNWTVNGTGTGYSVTVDAVNHHVGSSSLKLTTPDGAGYVSITRPVNWDLSASADQGNFRLWAYVHGADEPTDIQILMSNDVYYNNYFTTYYNASFKFPHRPGWNLINLRSSDWLVGRGSPTWMSPIVRVTFRIYGTKSLSYSLDGLVSGVTALPAVLFTFDDVHSTLYTQVYNDMKLKNVRGTGFIVTNWVGGSSQATWTQLLEMNADGWTIGNHSASHLDLSLLALGSQQAELENARLALIDHGLMNGDYVAYPFGKYNADTLEAMANLGMRYGRTLLNANNILPLQSPYEIAQRSIGRATPLATTQAWVDTAIARQEILVLTLHDISASPSAAGWYIDRFQELVDYCIQRGIPIITMDDLFRLQSGSITIPSAPNRTSLTINQAIGGTITATPAGPYSYGDLVTLSATSDPGWNFTGWGGNLVGTSNPAIIPMDGNKLVTAIFTRNAFTIYLSFISQGAMEVGP